LLNLGVSITQKIKHNYFFYVCLSLRINPLYLNKKTEN